MAFIIRNKSSRIIGVGKVQILPGTEAEIDESYRKNGTIRCFKEIGYIEVVDEEAKVVDEEAKVVDEEAKAETPKKRTKTVKETESED